VLQLANKSPFEAAFARFPDVLGADSLYVVVTATFQLWPELAISDTQIKPVLSDKYFGDPGSSSLRYGCDLHLGKPVTDLILVGHARSIDEKPVTQLDVRLRLADREKRVKVIGDRHWNGFEASPPAPFVSMPLVYERAFGGVLKIDDAPPLTEERNPLGLGLAVSHRRAQRGDPMPNLEDPKQLLADGVLPAPAGFGAIPPAWLSRRSLAGTYDEEWQRKRAPYLPADFQRQYFNCAAEGLVFDRHLQGGEPLLLEGASARGPLRSVLPQCAVMTAFVLRGERHVRPSHLQTVLLEPDENRLCLTYHADFPCDKAALAVERIEIGLDGLQLAAAGSKS
jgi:hypothetical protein